MKDDKYITFKREEWDKTRDHARMHNLAAFRVIATLEGGQLDDAFVLRTQDRFVEATINAYVSAILNTIEILKEVPAGGYERAHLDLVCERLVRIADVATQRGMEAHVGAKRMPT